jgi:hypothetical protein
MGVINMKDVKIAYMVKVKGAGAPLLGKIKMEGVSVMTDAQVTQIFGSKNTTGTQSIDYLIKAWHPEIAASAVRKLYLIEAQSITNECVDVQQKTINIPMEAFDNKAFMAYRKESSGAYTYLMLFQSHIDKDKVHALRIIAQYNNNYSELSVIAGFPHVSLPDWKVTVPQELAKYIQAHIETERPQHSTITSITNANTNIQFNRYKQNLHLDQGKVYSYNTHVATVEGNSLRVLGYWSKTTAKHTSYVAQELGLKQIQTFKA